VKHTLSFAKMPEEQLDQGISTCLGDRGMSGRQGDREQAEKKYKK